MAEGFSLPASVKLNPRRTKAEPQISAGFSTASRRLR